MVIFGASGDLTETQTIRRFGNLATAKIYPTNSRS